MSASVIFNRIVDDISENIHDDFYLNQLDYTCSMTEISLDSFFRCIKDFEKCFENFFNLKEDFAVLKLKTKKQKKLYFDKCLDKALKKVIKDILEEYPCIITNTVNHSILARKLGFRKISSYMGSHEQIVHVFMRKR